MKLPKAKAAIYPFILSVALLFVLSSCLPDNNDANQTSSRIRVILNLSNVNNPIGDDSLEIGILKFVHGESYFLRDSDSLLLKEEPEIRIHQNGQEPSQLLVDGVLNEGSLQELHFVIEPPPETVANVDPDFIAGDTLYSIVIEGVYQDSAFTFKSTESFSSIFQLSPPPDAESNSRYRILLVTDIANWFLSNDGQVINPRDTANVDLINGNIEGSFQLGTVEEF